MAHWLWLFWIASSKAPSFSRSKENPIGLVPPNRRALLTIYLPRRPHKPRRFAPPRNQLGGSRPSAKMASFFGAAVTTFNMVVGYMIGGIVLSDVSSYT